MEENLIDIIEQIRKRADKEYEQAKTARAICRGRIVAPNGQDRVIWVTNVAPEYTQQATYYYDGTISSLGNRSCTALMEPGELVVPKNREYAQRLLRYFDGHHSVKFDGRLVVFDILNSANYTIPSNGRSADIFNINAATAEMSNFMVFADLIEARKRLSGAIAKQNAAREEEEQAKQRLAELEAQRKRDEEERQRQLQEARDAEEKRRLEEERKRIEEERQRQIEKELERQRKAEEERKRVEEELVALSDKYKNAAKFIRKQASLRLNPNLSDEQEAIKRSHVLDGTTLVINGGPGTGKTTTLIQRLKLLISKGDLLDYRENNEGCKLTDEQISIATDPERNWIFFSPTELLRQFMRDNMNYEGLTDTNRKTVVWTDYLKKTLVRDKYQFAGDDYPFDFAKSSMNEQPIYTGNHVTIINRFIREYITEMKKKLQVVASLDTSTFEWKEIGKKISEVCKEVEKRITAPATLVRLMLELDKMRDLAMPYGILTAKDVVDIYKREMQRISTSYLAEWQKDEDFYKELVEMAKTWKNKNLTEEEEEEVAEEDEEEVIAGAENKLFTTLKALIKRMALNTIDSKITISGRNRQLYDKVGDRMNPEDFNALAEYAYFMQYFYPLIHNYEGYLLGKITSVYKNFRREALKTKMQGWNKPLLKRIVDDEKNRPLCQQEQALLIGFINNLLLSIRSVSVRRFDALKHKYAVAYKDVCRPVIGVDEATDYTIVDFYAINSLRHYKVSSFTLTGDMMQGMRLDGITDWMDLQRANIFSEVVVSTLTMSYRQSPKLMRLAEAIYVLAKGESSPYKCKLEGDETCPNPLLLESDDEEEKAEWIAERVLEVKAQYGFVPSIAVFVADKNDAPSLEAALREDGRLENNGIDVKNCSEGDNLAASDMVRIFPLEKVKGMEFEVVFFHNIDKVQATKMISRYLYVGLSRATFFMGVTASDVNVGILPDILDQFDRENTWSQE